MISKNGVELIKSLEGFVPLEYVCVAGKRTIGYGHVMHPDEKYPCGIDEKTAELLLQRDLKIAEDAVDALVKVSLSSWQKEALVSFVFNIGAYAFSKSMLLRVLNELRYDLVERQLMRWVYVNGRPCEGLMRRRRAEADYFMNRGRKRSFFYGGREHEY